MRCVSRTWETTRVLAQALRKHMAWEYENMFYCYLASPTGFLV